MTFDLAPILLVLSPLCPLLLAAALLWPKWRLTVHRLVGTAALPALAAALWPAAEMELELPWLLLGAGLELDEVSRTFLLFSAILWTVGGLALPAEGRSRFSAWFLLSMTGNFALLLAQDIPLFYLAYALMSLASFGLVIHTQTRQARRAARVYLVFAVLGEMLLLVALVMVSHNAETLYLEFVMDRTPQPLLMALLLFGFGIKAGTPLLHLALPPAYAVTPLAAAVPMAGALLHLGLYGWMRFLPLGQIAVPQWSMIFVGVGAIAMFYGVVVGLTQRKTRPLLAYSSISQMGLMTMAIGIGLGSPRQWLVIQPVLLVFALHHALAKGALFQGLGVPGRSRLALCLPALALAGLPFTGGALAKGLLKAQVPFLPDAWSGLVAWAISLGSVGTTLLMARFLYLALSNNEASHERTGSWSWWLLLIGMLLLPWTWPLPIERFSPLWGALWPVLLGAGLAWLVYRGLFARLLAKVPAIPPGDLLMLAESLLQRIPWPQTGHPAHKQEHDAVLQPRESPWIITLPERMLARWQVAVGLLVLLMLALFLLLAGR